MEKTMNEDPMVEIMRSVIVNVIEEMDPRRTGRTGRLAGEEERKQGGQTMSNLYYKNKAVLFECDRKRCGEECFESCHLTTDIEHAKALDERMKSVIIDVIEELDPPPDDEIIVTKNGIAMMNVETFHELTNGQYKNAVGMPGLKWTKDGPVRKEEKE